MRKLLVSTIVLGAAIVAAGACRSPTEVTLSVETDFPCDKLQGVAFVVAPDPKSVDDRVAFEAFTARTTQCDGPSRVGTLVVLPNGGSAAVTVIAGVRRPVEQCSPKDNYKDCIVARRSFAFVDHVPLTIPIFLRESCIDVPCDAFTTCARGTCVSSTVDCSSDGCSDPEANAPAADASPDARVDGSLPDGAVPDAPFDAPADAPIDTGVDAPGVACTPSCNGAACPAGTVCCQTFGGRTCMSQASCLSMYMQLCCTSAAECLPGQVCCINSPSPMPGKTATCATSCVGMEVCRDFSSSMLDCPRDAGSPQPVCTLQGGGLYTCPSP